MKKTFKIISLIISLTLILSGCGDLTDNKGENEKSYSDTNSSYDEKYSFRDKKDLYKMYEAEDIDVMYLTVMEGNEAENTNHTWSEINTYSVYDYEDMGVERYKVEGLLQLGDKDGPIPGNLGYGQVSPNCTVQIRGQSSSRQSVKPTPKTRVAEMPMAIEIIVVAVSIFLSICLILSAGDFVLLSASSTMYFFLISSIS